MRELYLKHRYVINKILFIVGLFVFVFLFFNFIFGLIAPFIVAYILSLILNPLADFITAKIKAPRWFASLFCILLIVFIITLLSTNILSRIFKEAGLFIANIPMFASQISVLAQNLEERYSHIFDLLPDSYQQYFNEIILSIVGSLSSTAGNLFKNSSVNIVSQIPNILVIFLLTLISTFFFISDRDLIIENVKKNTPFFISKNVSSVRKGLLSALTGYIKAQAIIMCMTGTIAIVVLSILKYEYAMFVGLVIAFIDALPIFGSGFVLWPWIAISFLSSDYKTAIGLLILYGTILVTRQIAEPRVLGKQIGMHPLVTLMSMYVGLRIFGVFGFIIGPVAVITIKSLLNAETEEEHLQ